jgi:hypothetical protein
VLHATVDHGFLSSRFWKIMLNLLNAASFPLPGLGSVFLRDLRREGLGIREIARKFKMAPSSVSTVLRNRSAKLER